MKIRPDDVLGKTFGWLTVLSPSMSAIKGGKPYNCRCKCGRTVPVADADLVKGRKKSCGCRQGNTVHGLSRDRTWNIWRGMVGRCHGEWAKGGRYQTRGIVVCERWRESFDAFLEDMGDVPYGHSIDRIDNDGDYEPGNCRWATPIEQNRNKSNNVWLLLDGRRMIAQDWAAELGVASGSVRHYAKIGLLDRVQPPKQKKCQDTT
jgi:hypothetical protein